MSEPKPQEQKEPFTGPFRVGPGEYPEPDTVLDASNKPVPLEWLCGETARLRQALYDASEYLYNPFEPDNQSQGYNLAMQALAISPSAAAPPPAMESEREAFEAWAKSANFGIERLAGEDVVAETAPYELRGTQWVWEAWQARSARTTDADR